MEVPFSFLIVCSGSSYASPIKPRVGSMEGGAELRMQGRLSVLRETAQRVQDASSVLIVGGGTVGVELAAEVGRCEGERAAAATDWAGLPC